MCVDLRQLNKVAKKDAYAMPRINDTLAALRGATYFTSGDCISGFYQMPLMEGRSQELTAFVTPAGLSEFRRVPMGYTNSPALFTRFMDQCLAALKWNCCLVYVDDILIFTNGTFKDHLRNVTKVFTQMAAYGLKMKPSKVQFCSSKVPFLGHCHDRRADQGIKTTGRGANGHGQPHTGTPEVGRRVRGPL
jgi:hypothetical protein